MTAATEVTAVDQRQHQRVAMALPGRLFVPAEGAMFECSIVNLSPGGAGVECDEPPPLNAFVVLYVDGFGRFDCVASRYVKGELGLRFVCKDIKRQRLMEKLTSYVQFGVTNTTHLRAHPRWRSNVESHFTQANGASTPCQVVDFSLHGISLRTDVKPPIGDMISVGHTHGRIVRHLDTGIAIQFIDIDESADNGR